MVVKEQSTVVAEVCGVGRTANSEQDARARARNRRLDRARARRLALDTGRAARDTRIDAAVADVYQAQEDKAAAAQAAADADHTAGEAIRRLIAEGMTTAQVAELCELTVTAVQRLKSDPPTRAGSLSTPQADRATVPATRVADAVVAER
jgi:hypothetical protein